MRQTLLRSIVLAAVLSGPLAAGAVFVHWTSIDRGVLFDGMSPALWSARRFLEYFDLLMLVSMMPCILWMHRVSDRVRVPPASTGCD